MDNEQFTQWLSAVSTQLNRVLRLMPPTAWERNVSMLLAQCGGDGLLQVASTLGIVDAAKFRLMVEQYPDLDRQLADEATQSAIRSWVLTSEFAPSIRALRLVSAWLAPPDRKTGNSQLDWHIEDMPDDGGVYRALLRGREDEKSIRNNQGEC